MDLETKKSEQDWKKILSIEQFHVLREKGTERPFTGKFWDNFEKGQYFCAACGILLFDSERKFKSDCGWPSFDSHMEGNIIIKDDYSNGLHRKEVLCKKCNGHLGHIFKDGPTITGKRYCINSISLKFTKNKK